MRSSDGLLFPSSSRVDPRQCWWMTMLVLTKHSLWSTASAKMGLQQWDGSPLAHNWTLLGTFGTCWNAVSAKTIHRPRRYNSSFGFLHMEWQPPPPLADLRRLVESVRRHDTECLAKAWRQHSLLTFWRHWNEIWKLCELYKWPLPWLDYCRQSISSWICLISCVPITKSLK